MKWDRFLFASSFVAVAKKQKKQRNKKDSKKVKLKIAATSPFVDF